MTYFGRACFYCHRCCSSHTLLLLPRAALAFFIFLVVWWMHNECSGLAVYIALLNPTFLCTDWVTCPRNVLTAATQQLRCPLWKEYGRPWKSNLLLSEPAKYSQAFFQKTMKTFLSCNKSTTAGCRGSFSKAIKCGKQYDLAI